MGCVRAGLAALWLLLVAGGCASQGTVTAALDDPTLIGTRWGLLAVALDGEIVAEVDADRRFSPASNTKIFTTAAAFALLDDLNQPGPDDGTSVRLEPSAGGGAPDLILIGAGDPSLGDGPNCVSTCLAELADATAAAVRRVGDVVGDDRLFPDERWGPGWAWDDLQEGYGTAVSALTVNDNVVVLEVVPGASVGSPVQARWRTDDDILPLTNEAITADDGMADLRIERRPGGQGVRLYGRMPRSGAASAMRVGLDDPALAAAIRLRRLLEQRGVVVEGEVRARHRPLTLTDDPAARIGAPPTVVAEGTEIARLTRPPLLASLIRTTKVSQNLHAELMLRRLGRLEGAGSLADGLAQVQLVMAEAGVARAAFDLHDGSGLSTYNRVSPRATTTFLLWTASQPWGEAWRATLPVAGRDGALQRRFIGTPLEGRVFAKTGTLSGVNAMAGFLTAASGRTIVFSIYANDRPSTAGSAVEAMDRTLLALAAHN
ncbi:D-alanyl-D-alanine carboxypeptidase/D-alanyl-D-alanine-endopeptidase [Brevundimonas sp. NIBR11]|uniref:D-alanyl-D-alanine carboxypeptidase/D-alanyl-D-alanine endopeptidase n=1 Tax=Brevundimonas sp. NIBR11 TaxID=3015999 RepID=UPI0022F12934|nr:D-alanyl-D-alanine carboxypeptidase/D-alanyl-D-alanine-endopeptidase [Brevundimonas sp. NIBR11]WGM31194.1 D-alanyl-D-alanine carboxypeptidase [Brevundimonas sp. NIBR11]